LADPILELHKPDGSVVTNDNWKTNLATHLSQEAEVRATGVPPSNDLESAIVETLSPGSYTAIVRGKNNRTGIGLVEVYDLDSSVDSTLANISTRGLVQTQNNVMIGGFIVGPPHSAASRIAVRALGPSTGISGALQDPMLELHDHNGNVAATNDDWQDDANADDIRTYHLAPANPHESAMVRMLLPGAYTAIVRGANSATGVALVEVYNVR
jgi:predicted methyltransferase MtxX (methanogen marker protein 4)